MFLCFILARFFEARLCPWWFMLLPLLLGAFAASNPPPCATAGSVIMVTGSKEDLDNL
jgi:hypothetical protein